MAQAVIDLTGQQFGRWTVLARAEPTRHGPRWFCHCACGREKAVLQQNLCRGFTQGCGCQRGHITHGHSRPRTGGRTRTYRAWESMKRRILAPACTDFPRYGGRGIRICERWMTSYENFLADMGECPPELMLDRIDNDGHYEPANCRWADRTVQNGNRRSNSTVQLDGITMIAAEAARKLGIPQLDAIRLQARIDRLGRRRPR